MQHRGRLVLVTMFLLFVTACSRDDAVTSTTQVASTRVATTLTEDPVDPFIGTWRTIDDDGFEVEIVISPGSGSTYAFVMTDGHAVACEDFGAPVTGVIGGKGEATGSELRLTYESLVCQTSWGEITRDRVTREVFHLENDVLSTSLPTCFRQGPAQPCEGTEPPEPIAADADIDSLVAEYGLEWVQDNYAGDLTDIGLDPAQLHPCLIPDETPDLSTWEITFTDLGGLPRTISCGPGGVWVHQRNDGNTLLLDPDGVRGVRYPVGEPKGNGALVVFHTFTSIDFTTDPGSTSASRLADVGVTDAVPFGDTQILTAGDEVVLYDLDGSRAWTIPSGSQGEFVLGVDAWWVADNVGQLIRIPLDGTDPMVIEVPDAIVPGPVNNRLSPEILPFDGGAWITNGDDTIQFVTEDGELGEKVKVGPALRYDGLHTLGARGLNAYDEYLYTTDADGVTYKVRLDGSAPPEVTEDQIPFAQAAGLAWFLDRPQVPADQPGILFALDSDGNKVLEFAYRSGQSLRWTWGHGALWLSDQIGFVARIGPG